jgi:hypothetical protein
MGEVIRLRRCAHCSVPVAPLALNCPDCQALLNRIYQLRRMLVRRKKKAQRRAKERAEQSEQ